MAEQRADEEERVCGARIPESDLQKYSVHSFRITAATILAAAKCPIDKIKRMLRWRAVVSHC